MSHEIHIDDKDCHELYAIFSMHSKIHIGVEDWDTRMMIATSWMGRSSKITVIAPYT